MKVLVIDDLRSFPETYKGVVYARTSQEALDTLAEGVDYDQIWWDHDLGINPETGEDDTTIRVVKQVCLESENFADCMMVIHTANPVGARNIKQYFDRSGLKSVIVDARSNYLFGGA